MLRQPFFSIILPTYNVERYISRSLTSCLSQEFSDYEILVVDDCGQDNSISIAKKYATQDNRIKIIHNIKNLGTYHARRVGVINAKGRYILFLDPDDELEENSLIKISKKLEKNPSDMLFFGVNLISPRKWYNKHIVTYPKTTNGWVLRNFFFQGNRWYLSGTAGKIYSRKFINRVYSFAQVPISCRFIYAEDVFLLIHSMLLFPTYSKLEAPLYKYYSNPTSITQKNSKQVMNENMQQYQYFLDKTQQSIAKLNLQDKDIRYCEKLMTRFKSDYYLLSRHLDDNQHYIKSTALSLRYKLSLSTFTRLSLAIITAGKIKI